MCLCTATGRELRLLRESCYAEVTKPVAKPKTEARELLRDGFFMLRLLGEDRDIAAPAPLVPEDDSASPVREFLFHMGYHPLSPWKPTFHRLLRVDAPAGEPPSSDARIYTQAKGLLGM